MYIIAIASIVRSIMLPPSFEMDTSYRLENGASLAGLYDVVDGGRLQTIRLKHAFKKDAATLATIQPGTYVFS